MSNENNKGLDYDKLNRFQKKRDVEFDNIKKSFEEIYNQNKLILKENFKFEGIDANKFATWYYDNHFVKKNRRFPHKLNYAIIAEFCSLLYQSKIESNREASNAIPINQKIENIVFEVFKDDSFAQKDQLDSLVDEVIYILKEDKLPKGISLIKNKFIGVDYISIRTSFYTIYLLKKRKEIRILLIQYLHRKFECFEKYRCKVSEIPNSETYKKFAPLRKIEP
jgi:hypothetical protein